MQLKQQLISLINIKYYYLCGEICLLGTLLVLSKVLDILGLKVHYMLYVFNVFVFNLCIKQPVPCPTLKY